MDLNKLESKLDDALSKETTESLTNWLNIKRMEKKQTAVDFLLNTVIGEDAQGNDFYLKDALLDTEIYQAKEMEKEQINEAHTLGYIIGGGNGDLYNPKEYYIETFKSE